MKNILKKLWKDESGLTTLEIIVGSLLLGGAATLVGYAFTAGFRGKSGDFVGSLEDIKAINDEITETSSYTFTTTNDSATGIATSATGN